MLPEKNILGSASTELPRLRYFKKISIPLLREVCRQMQDGKISLDLVYMWLVSTKVIALAISIFFFGIL